MRISVLFLGALSLSCAALLPAQSRRDRDRDRDRDDTESTIDTTVTLGRGAVVDLSLVSGEIIVTGWARGEATVHATSERGDLEFQASSGRLSLEVRGGRHGMGDTRFEVSVPYGTRVLTHSVSGDQEIRGVRGEVEARTVSGDLQVDDVGTLTFESVSGDVRIGKVGGELEGSSVSGDIDVGSVMGDLHLESTSGEVTVDYVRAKIARIETVSGEIAYSGPIDRAGRYDFRTHSGDITLGLPGDVGAQLEMQTFSGDIDSDFPLRLDPERDDDRPGSSQRHVTATLGGGGARITANTFSGTVHLQRASGADKE